jgi:signal transduction histidine kinase/CheY-like chemotaxis protein
MKKFYILFLAIPVLAFTLLWLSVWWFVGGVAAVMVFIAYQFYASRFNALQDRNEVLEKELEDLNEHLERSVVKEQKVSKEIENIRVMKQQLLSVISHEVRTPMNGIMGSALLMQETSMTKEQEDYLTTIRNCGESLLTMINTVLVNDILDISKIQQDDKLEYKGFNLRDSIEEVVDLFADKAGRNGIDLLYEIDENVPEQIVGDTKRFRQVVMNLVENAVRFTSKGEVFVRLHYSKHNALGNHPELTLEVSDTGIGVTKDQLKQLFTGIPAKKTERNAEATSGLGLMICKKLVELMGGTIEARSEQGQGSTFIFSIPVTPSLKIVRSHAREIEMINLENKQILIVAGNSTTRSVLSNQLKSWKMQPVTASTAEQALDILAKNKDVTAILTDLLLPGMDGIRFAKAVKDQYAAIRIIGMKTMADKNYGQEPDLFASVLIKPARQHILRDHILNLFSQTSNDKQSGINKMSGLFAEQYPQDILIAEDNPINQKIATKILTSLGYKPAIANNGKEAVEMVSNEKYDIILMDVQMPEMDGLEATRMIRTCLEVQPVIIAMTANVMQGDRDACMQAGMDDYMSKPIDLKELLNQLEKWHKATQEKRKAS